MIKNRIKSGFNELDKILISFAPGKLHILCGRPGMGKTSLMTDMSINIAQHIPVHIFSLEESKKYLLKRLNAKTKNIDNLPIYIYDNCLKLNEITEKIETNVKDGIIFIDYLQLIKVENDAVTALKNLAMQSRLPIVVLSQLNRSADERGQKGLPPTFENIGIHNSQEIDTFIFLYRKAYYNHDECDNEAELTVVKKIIGNVGNAVIRFDEKAGTFFE